MVKQYRHPGYAGERPLVPHGVSVILNSPAVFRFTAEACPDRHLTAARALGAPVNGVAPEDAGKVLTDRIIEMMMRLKVPNGLRAIGYEPADIPALVEGTLPQHRVTKLSPRSASRDDLTGLFEDAMTIW
jgi:hydroxyacid-oxoacid transhydrogenase